MSNAIKYIRIPVSLSRNPVVSIRCRLLYGEIDLVCRENQNVCVVSDSEFADRLSISAKSVKEYILELKSLELVFSLRSSYQSKIIRELYVERSLYNLAKEKKGFCI